MALSMRQEPVVSVLIIWPVQGPYADIQRSLLAYEHSATEAEPTALDMQSI